MLNNKFKILKKGKVLFCLFLFFLCCFAFVPYNEIIRDAVFRFAVSHVNVNAENLVLYKYKVYGTEKTFNKSAFVFVEEEKNFLKSKNEFIVVKIAGEYSIEYKTDYILINEKTVPDLNVEIYIAQNIDFGNNSLPCKTVVLLLQRLLNILVFIFYAIMFLIFYINLCRYFLSKARV